MQVLFCFFFFFFTQARGRLRFELAVTVKVSDYRVWPKQIRRNLASHGVLEDARNCLCVTKRQQLSAGNYEWSMAALKCIDTLPQMAWCCLLKKKRIKLGWALFVFAF